MNAKKCDRCGELYDPPMYTPDVRVDIYRHPYGDRWLDLCFNCQAELEDFLKIKFNPRWSSFLEEMIQTKKGEV